MPIWSPFGTLCGEVCGEVLGVVHSQFSQRLRAGMAAESRDAIARDLTGCRFKSFHLHLIRSRSFDLCRDRVQVLQESWRCGAL